MNDGAFTYTPPEPLVIEFSPAIKAGQRELSRLSVGEPRAEQVRSAESHLTERNGNRGSRMYQRTLLSKVSGVPEDILDALPISHFQRAANFMQGFVQAGTDADEDDNARDTLAIAFDPPLEADKATIPRFAVREPSLEHMMKSDSFLRDMTPERVRAFQMNLVSLAAGENGGLSTVGMLPISVLNRAATFCMGFTNAGRAMQTS